MLHSSSPRSPSRALCVCSLLLRTHSELYAGHSGGAGVSVIHLQRILGELQILADGYLHEHFRWKGGHSGALISHGRPATAELGDFGGGPLPAWGLDAPSPA